MFICNTRIHCPYWSNKLRGGLVILRGFQNGKGDAARIQKELEKKVIERNENENSILTTDVIYRIARRNRIGIDCSGFVYRALENLVQEIRSDTGFTLSSVYSGGVNRTNAAALTDMQFVKPIDTVCDVREGDMIRMMGGKHVAIVTGVASSEISYTHSSQKSQIFGVHEAIIEIQDNTRDLGFGNWKEETIKGENFGKKYYEKEKGDGVFRLRNLKEYA